LDNAPLYSDIAEGPPGGKAYWVTTRDGVRLRVGAWATGSKGTVMLMPGRTEYIEKYGRIAGDLAAEGFAMIAIDWRGQGLADRVAEPSSLGHVGEFKDYQYDVEAMVRACEVLRLPLPWFVLGHSMGGAIGLRALSNGLPVKAAAFSAPMWGIQMKRWLRPVAWTLGIATHGRAMGKSLTPGTKRIPYTEIAPFKGNMLTRDKDSYTYMSRQTKTYPALSIGGPSLHWLYESLLEMRRLRKQQQPKTPCITWIGEMERIVDPEAVEDVMNHWPNGKLIVAPGAEHEIMMELPEVRKAFIKSVTQHFAAQL